MIGYLSFCFIFVFTTFSLYGHPPAITVDYEERGTTPLVSVQATGTSVTLQSADPTIERAAFEKMLASKPSESVPLPHCSDLDSWLAARDTRRRNLSLYHLYKITSSQDDTLLGYIDLTHMPTDCRWDGAPYTRDKHEDILKLWQELDTNDSNDKPIKGRGLAAIFPIVTEDTPYPMILEAVNLAYELINNLTNFFPLPGTCSPTPIDNLPSKWNLILANIHFEAQRKLAGQFEDMSLPYDQLRRLREADDAFNSLCSKTIENKPVWVSTTMGGETENHAHQIVAVISPESPLRKAFLEAKYTPRKKKTYGRICDTPRMVFFKPVEGW